MNLLKRLDAIRRATPISDAAKRQEIWDACWSAHDARPFMGEDEAEHVAQLVRELGGKYFDSDESSAPIKGVVEFGCGAGDNLLHFAKRYPVLGLDWSQSAVDRCVARGIPTKRFDMFFAHPRVDIADWGVLTVHAMEQLGENWGPMLAYLLNAGPAVVVHIEPVYELYDNFSMGDLLRAAYHRRRSYLRGYLPALESRADVEILEVRKATFHGPLHDANSVIVWRPK